mgnify:CR=1 FL=1
MNEITVSIEETSSAIVCFGTSYKEAFKFAKALKNCNRLEGINIFNGPVAYHFEDIKLAKKALKSATTTDKDKVFKKTNRHIFFNHLPAWLAFLFFFIGSVYGVATNQNFTGTNSLDLFWAAYLCIIMTDGFNVRRLAYLAIDNKLDFKDEGFNIKIEKGVVVDDYLR